MNEPQVSITAEILQLIADIDQFKGKWDHLRHLSPDRLSQLRKVATIESIGSSTRIEGAKLTDAEVETLLSGLSSTSFKTRDEQEVAGYAEAMDTVFQAYEDMALTENHIRQLHQILLRHSDKDERHRGDYKKLSNHVVAFDPQGNEIGVVFQTSTPFETPLEMEELVRCINKAILEKSLHPLLIVGIFVVSFLAIHPFQDGNGRLSRILTTLLLLRAGYGYVPYASLESVVEENKELYYRALRRTQSTLKSEHPDWEPWLHFFLRCLKEQKNNLVAKVELPVLHQAEMSSLALKVMELLKKQDRLTIAEMVKRTRANQNTLKVHLRQMVAAGLIERHGKARATWYSLKEITSAGS